MTRHRTFRPLLLALVLGVLGWHGLTLTASAGGPTSVLLVDPGRGQVAAAYHSDSRYAALSASVGEGQTGPSTPPSHHAGGHGEEVRLTWLIHDMQIWRIDRIHLTDDGVWVETVVDIADSGDVYGRPAVWHRPADEAALIAALTEAGLLGAEPPVRTEASVPDPAAPGPGLVLAAVAGLVVGVGGTLAGVRARTRTASPRVTLTG